MKQNRLRFVASLIILGTLSLGVLFAPLLATRAADNTLLDSQVGLNKIGTQFGANNSHDVSLTIIVIRIINISLGILGLLVVVLIIVSGYQWMTAGGNEDQIKSAKKRMVNAIIGLLIILVAFAVTAFILGKLITATTGIYTNFNSNYNYQP